MPTLTINGQSLQVADGTTLLGAARQMGIKIPTLCYRKGYAHVTSCMLCVVEDLDTGAMRPACSTVAEKGMNIRTDSEAVHDSRRVALELLLSDHLGDCEGPCRRACPANMNIPLMIRQIKDGDIAAAVATVKRDIPFPAILGRICPAPCEKACRRKQLDSPLAICRLKQFVGDSDLEQTRLHEPPLAAATHRRVAIVGGGPAGLTAAYYLRHFGHECVVYDKNNRLGGGMRTGTDRAVLPESVLDAEVDTVLDLGVTVQLGCTIGAGRDVDLEVLVSEYDAVVLTVGKSDQVMAEKLGLTGGTRGIKVDRQTLQTDRKSVFAGGAAVTPSRLAVRAVADGKRLAVSVNQYLTDSTVAGVQKRFDSVSGRLSNEEVREFCNVTDQKERISGDPGGLSPAEAAAEAERCLHCDCRKPLSCKLRRYATEYEASQRRYKARERRRYARSGYSELVYEPGKCIACGICVRITEKEREDLGLTFIGRGFDVRVGVPFNESLEAGLKSTADKCVRGCPTGALAYTNTEEISRKLDR